MRIFAWNVNGLRACHRKGRFVPFVEAHRPDVLCLQEVRARPEQVPGPARAPRGMHGEWHLAEKKGYSGVTTFSVEPPDRAQHGIGEARFDAEGRVLITDHGPLTVVNAYFPHGQREHQRLPFKTDFYRAMLALGGRLRDAGRRVVLCGDWNTAHRDIDLKNHKSNRKTSGFTDAERALIDEFEAAGWVDAWRALHPEDEVYTWWSSRKGVRERNVGWRIDMFLVDAATMEAVRGARIHDDVMGSDHCPLEIELAV